MVPTPQPPMDHMVPGVGTTLHTHTHIQTDGDYTKHVVETLRDHTLNKNKVWAKKVLSVQLHRHSRSRSLNEQHGQAHHETHEQATIALDNSHSRVVVNYLSTINALKLDEMMSL